MSEQNSTLRPEDVEVETFQPVPASFHYVDEDPTDPASGTDQIVENGNGTRTRI